jgi:hypothetical protein
VDTGMISPGDLGLFHFVETAEEAWEVLAAHYGFDLPTPTQTGDLRRRHLSARAMSPSA